MPYAEPTSPIPSPVKERPKFYRRHSHNTSHDFHAPSPPMPTLPRRAASSSTSTPRKGTFHNAPRTAANSAHTDAIEAMRAVGSLPRAPASQSSGLGLKLHGASPHTSRESQSSKSSATTSAPEERHVPLASSNSSSLLQRQRRLSASSMPSPIEPLSPVCHTRPSDRMVRKKSGELVKPSLKSRSLSTPDLTRGGAEGSVSGKSKSSHNLRERTKSVRFDDGELESVVLFLRSQKPAAVSKAADGNDNPVDGDDDNDMDLSDYVHFRTRRNGGPRGAAAAAAAAEEQTEIMIDNCSSIPRVRLDFGPGTEGLLENEFVVLERVEMCQPLALRGSILVRNIAFEKWVTVRFTLDEWQTVSEVSAQHASHVPAGTTGDEGWDRFSFNIKLEDYRRKIEERSFHFCVRYNANGGEWWDSNGGDNYRMSFKTQSIRRQRPTTTSPFFTGSLTGGTTTTDTMLAIPRRTPQTATKGPRNWVFPRAPAAVEARPDSPALSPPPQGAFRPPSAPDVHHHLRLNKYCAPSPPQSPPQKLAPAAGLKPIVLPLAPERTRAAPPPMTLVHGRPATEYIPMELTINTDDDVFATTSEESSGEDDTGDVTPVAARARSPETRPILDGAAFTSSPITTTNIHEQDRATPIPRTSTAGDLRSLASVNTSVGLMTPPNSNLSSPPTPTNFLTPESPTTSMSTGDSSPVNTLNSATPDEDASIDDSRRGRMLNAASYQEFLDKFCFFKSPPSTSTPLDEQYSGSYFPPVTGYPASGYYGFNLGSTTPPGAMTPTFEGYAHARAKTPTNASGNSASGSTPRASPSRSPASSAFPLPWTPSDDAATAPSLAA